MGCRWSRVRISPPRPIETRVDSESSRVFVSPRFPSQNRHCVDFASFGRGDPVDRLDQVRYIGRGIVRGDAPVLMPEQHLTILERNPCGPKPPAKRVLEIVHAYSPITLRGGFIRFLLPRLSGALARAFPGGVVHLGKWPVPLVGKYPGRVLAALRFDDRLGDIV